MMRITELLVIWCDYNVKLTGLGMTLFHKASILVIGEP